MVQFEQALLLKAQWTAGPTKPGGFHLSKHAAYSSFTKRYRWHTNKDYFNQWTFGHLLKLCWASKCGHCSKHMAGTLVTPGQSAGGRPMWGRCLRNSLQQAGHRPATVSNHNAEQQAALNLLGKQLTCYGR